MPAGIFMIFLTGRFSVQNKVEEGLFFRLDGAAIA